MNERLSGRRRACGPARLHRLWRRPDTLVPAPVAVTTLGLLLPPIGAFATELLPNVKWAGPRATAVALWVGSTNALAEEALWRGVPLAAFPDERIRGWIWPAAGFTAWHLVPLSVRDHSPGRSAALLGGAAVIGLANGWVAQRTGSLAVVSAAHAATDSCGVRAARETWLAERSPLRFKQARHPSPRPPPA